MNSLPMEAPVATLHEVDDRDHLTCCADDDVALCGVDLTAVSWLPEGQDANCSDCHRLFEADEAWAASAENDSAPCPHCPLNVLGGAS